MKKRQEVTANHGKLFPVRVESDSQELFVYQPVKQVPSKLALQYQELSMFLNTSALYQPIFLNDLLPSDSKEWYVYLVELPLAIQNQTVSFTHTARNNKGNTHFIWRIPVDASQEELLNENGRVMAEIHKSIQYITQEECAMRLSVHLDVCAMQSPLYFVRSITGLQVILRPVPMFSRSKSMSVLD